MQFEYY